MSLFLCLDEGSADGSKATRFIRQLNPETRATLDALSKEYKEPTTSSVWTHNITYCQSCVCTSVCVTILIFFIDVGR